MKKQIVLFLTAALLTVSSVFSQLRKIPAEVTEAFKAKFPQAKNVSWTDKISSFQASFDQDETKMQASFNSKGEWKKTEKDLVLTDLPGVINKEMQNSKYEGWTIKSATQIVESDDKFEYRIQIEKSALKKKVIYISKEGEVLRESITL